MSTSVPQTVDLLFEIAGRVYFQAVRSGDWALQQRANAVRNAAFERAMVRRAIDSNLSGYSIEYRKAHLRARRRDARFHNPHRVAQKAVAA